MPRSGIIRTALLGGALAAGLTVAAPASAQEGSVIRDLLGAIGLAPVERPQIDYRERAPLVVPPNLATLPPPVDPRAATEGTAWPVDPEFVEMQRREREREADARRIGDRMTVEELRAGRRAGAGLVTEPQGPATERHWIHPRDLQEIDARRAAEAQRSGPMERRFLTDPPQQLLSPAAGGPVRDTGPVVRNEPDSAMDFIRRQNQRN